MAYEIAQAGDADEFEQDFGYTPEEKEDVLDRLPLKPCVGPSTRNLLPPILLAAFTDLARRLPKLCFLEWFVYEEEWIGSHVGSLAWTVRRTGGAVELVEDPERTTFSRNYCCASYGQFRHVERVVEEWLLDGRLFAQKADFTPKFTLDNFVVRRA